MLISGVSVNATKTRLSGQARSSWGAGVAASIVGCNVVLLSPVVGVDVDIFSVKMVGECVELNSSTTVGAKVL
eukprot:scaffold3701_cov149-Amphora_coffeaeformis.AAC.5